MDGTNERRGPIEKGVTVFFLAVLVLGTVAGPRTAAAQKADPVPSATELEARRDRIRQFYKDRLARLKIVATTVTPSGQVLDWIRPESQTADGSLAAPPPAPTLKNPGKTLPKESSRFQPTGKAARQAQTEVQMNPSLRGPAGTVPIVRFDVERYLASTPVPPADPSHIFGKIPPPAPDSSHRYYVAWQQDNGPFYGTSGVINLWDTVGPFRNNASIPKDTSIAQAAVTRPALSQAGNLMQSVEAGKLESAQLLDMNGQVMDQATFFVAFTTNGYTMNGAWLGGTNNWWGAGFIQHSATVAPDMILSPTSVDGGDQVELGVKIRRVRGNWWVEALGELVGYYPYCHGGNAPFLGPGLDPDPQSCPTGTLFSANGLRDQADRVQWYGEVFDAWAPAPTSTDMGSGAFASAGLQHAAYFRFLAKFYEPSGTVAWFFETGTLLVTDSNCYSGEGPTISVPPPNSPGVAWDWYNSFFFGGPGAEGPLCN